MRKVMFNDGPMKMISPFNLVTRNCELGVGNGIRFRPVNQNHAENKTTLVSGIKNALIQFLKYI